jgi:hypothetical protein
VDVNPHCPDFAAEGFPIHLRNRADRGFLRRLGQQFLGIDILGDDGEHLLLHQISTFEEPCPQLSLPPSLLVEDLHTSD